MSRLNPAQIVEMRALAAEGESADSLARRYGVRIETAIGYIAGQGGVAPVVIPRAKREAPDFHEPRIAMRRR